MLDLDHNYRRVIKSPNQSFLGGLQSLNERTGEIRP